MQPYPQKMCIRDSYYTKIDPNKENFKLSATFEITDCLLYTSLFAKVETGSIGAVTIQNCVAYGNGYLEDGTDAGNGNGFKMGGSSMSGYHKLINSVAFDNKAKGIDSNSCPDIQVTNSTSYNNGGSNVAMYTNDAANTDFMATGVLSWRTQKTSVNETFKFKEMCIRDSIYTGCKR